MKVLLWVDVKSWDAHLPKQIRLHRYRDGTTQGDSVVQWLWQTLESLTIEERVLFLRFVSGRSRLPTRVSEIPQRFQISVASGQVYILQIKMDVTE